MKLKLIISIIMLPLSFVCFGQDTIKAKYANEAMKSASGNEKSIFGGYITGVANLLSTSSGALNLQGTLYGIGKAITGKAKDTLDFKYAKHMLLRNTQINLGAVPDKQQNLQIDTMTFGGTFTILNNKIAKLKIWNKIVEEYRSSEKMILSLTTLDHDLYVSGDFVHDDSLRQFIIKRGKDSLGIDTTLRTMILKKTGAKYLKQIFAGYDEINEEFSKKVSKQWLWTAAINWKYDFPQSHTSGYIVSSTISKVLWADNKNGRQFSLQLTPSYTNTRDTTEKTINTNRNFSNVVFGGNYKICKSFEINLLGSWIHIIDGLYKNEKEEQYALSITPRIKINNNFWLPITIKYDPIKPQFFGFIAIQYSLK